MTATERRRCSVLVAALTVLVVMAAGLGPGRTVGQSPSGKAAFRAEVLGPQPAGLVDTRLQRGGAGATVGDPTAPQPGFAGTGGPRSGPSAWTRARAADPHRSALPEPGRQTSLRGPPGTSA